MRYKGKKDRRNRVGSSAAQYIVEVGIEKFAKTAPRISNPGSEKKFRFRLSVLQAVNSAFELIRRAGCFRTVELRKVKQRLPQGLRRVGTRVALSVVLLVVAAARMVREMEEEVLMEAAG